MSITKILAAATFVFIVSATALGICADALVVDNYKQVSLEYTLVVDGKIIDSSEKNGILEYTHGKGQIVEGLSKQLEGMRVGEEKAIVVPPEEAYGLVNPNAIKEVPKSSMPAEAELKPGMFLVAKSNGGATFPVKIVEVKKDTVMVDFNHPLAGKTLHFQVKVVSIK